MATAKARIGDVVEVKTPTGLGYFQYTHDGKGMGELVRVLPGLFSVRPTDLMALAKGKELYFVFYGLNLSLKKKLVSVVSNQPVPPWAREYPLMRNARDRDSDGKVLTWMILPADFEITLQAMPKIPIIKELTPEQERLSIHSLWAHPFLVRRLAQGWTPERAEEFRLRAAAEQMGKTLPLRIKDHSQATSINHYMYFRQNADATKAGQELRERGFSIVIRRGVDGVNWLVLASAPVLDIPSDIEIIRSEMQSLAERLNGEYDGWEAGESRPVAK